MGREGGKGPPDLGFTDSCVLFVLSARVGVDRDRLKGRDDQRVQGVRRQIGAG